ncbi:MAG TPA: hypothetical protein VL523_13350 [Terriglobia bacterium]|nr:hypothetical protein [Terriglobia bacterium]
MDRRSQCCKFKDGARSARQLRRVRRGPAGWARLVCLAALALWCCLACQDRTGRVRVEHNSGGKKAGANNAELAGRVVFAVNGQGIPASGANIILVDTASGKLLLEHLQKETDPACLKRLTGMETFVLNLARADAQAGHPPPTATADADGYFLLPQIKPGAYLVVAYGRANALQAIWEQPAMVENYQAVMLKMVEPLLSCTEDRAAPLQPPPVVPPAP